MVLLKDTQQRLAMVSYSHSCPRWKEEWNRQHTSYGTTPLKSVTAAQRFCFSHALINPDEQKNPKKALTISMTSLRRLWRCRLVRFWKMSQFSWCSSLKPTARWWFSRTDSSLYISASSESAGTRWALVKHRDETPAEEQVSEFSGVLFRAWAHWCWWGTDWKLQDGRRHGSRRQTEQPGSPDQWIRPENTKPAQ